MELELGMSIRLELRSETVEVVEGNQEESENIHNVFRSPGKGIVIFYISGNSPGSGNVLAHSIHLMVSG